MNSIKKLVDDRNFQFLLNRLKKFNIFSVLNIEKREIRHSQFLAWLLDPNGNHELGYGILEKFLFKIFPKDQIPDLVHQDSKIYTEFPISNTEKLDIFIINSRTKALCIIENKVEASEHDDQLLRYKIQLDIKYPDYKHNFIYLSAIPINQPLSLEVIQADYQKIYSLLKEINLERIENHEVAVFIQHYIHLLEKEEIFVNNQEFIEKCKLLYKEHKEVIDTIIKYKDAEVEENLKLFEEVIKETDKRFYWDDYSKKNEVSFIPIVLYDAYLELNLIDEDIPFWIIEFKFSRNNSNYDFNVYLRGALKGERGALRIQLYDLIQFSPSVFLNRKKLHPKWHRIFSSTDYIKDLTGPIAYKKDKIVQALDSLFIDFKDVIELLRNFAYQLLKKDDFPIKKE